ncbi:alpha,alpha-trehalose-phosphate synthase (UDP-forming) [Pararhizobium haloflavum]|uniref:alpha,alpha-trehalose-phosphate synthase (UDP-forming) n=1 Tax=Pararhizobium haloflavum TaxID=2037914 RepID=UPI000C18F945|nr:trehalose-6-phosphate synthase [Pararhizobium haloflavum]
MSRLVIVSNRVADLRKRTQTGGLAVGLADAMRCRGGLWFGWNGKIEASPPEQPHIEQFDNVQMVSLPLTREDYEQYYLGYANAVLWPLFHYRLDLTQHDRAAYAGYRRVNAMFARHLAPQLREDDIVWIHDYHLLTLAEELRRVGCRQRIGFFLHIPFPPHEILSATSEHFELINALLAHDLIGFQTKADLENFNNYLGHHFSCAGDTLYGQADAFPIGIDVEDFSRLSQSAGDDILIDRIRRGILGRSQIVGVDRLDYSKGLPERMRAFDRLLELYPEHQRTVSYLQIAPPTREEVAAYADIRVELERFAGAINGRHADFNWTPIKYIHRNVSRDKLAGIFQTSNVGLVTPLRDGMNLVAKEYVAAQDPKNPGVLVLSRFAGAAEQLEEALQVNPYDIDSVAKALHAALIMPLEERQDRHTALLARIKKQDAKWWVTTFVERLGAVQVDGKDTDCLVGAA